MFKEIVDDGCIGRSQNLTLSTSCSGELKKKNGTVDKKKTDFLFTTLDESTLERTVWWGIMYVDIGLYCYSEQRHDIQQPLDLSLI